MCRVKRPTTQTRRPTLRCHPLLESGYDIRPVHARRPTHSAPRSGAWAELLGYKDAQTTTPPHWLVLDLFAAENPERAAQLNCITCILVIDARHDGDFGDIPIGPLSLKCCQQDGLILLQPAIDKLRRISEEEDVDATI